MSKKQIAQMKAMQDEDGKLLQLALRAAWMREQGKRAKDWQRLGQKGRDDYREERVKRRNAAVDAAWLAERGAPCSHLYCGMSEEELGYLDGLWKRFDLFDAAFDAPVESAKPLDTAKQIEREAKAMLKDVVSIANYMTPEMKQEVIEAVAPIKDTITKTIETIKNRKGQTHEPQEA